jgi:superfamily I DNA and/or RNA helicase
MSDGNKSECEAFHVRRLIEELWPHGPPRSGELAILTPYRRQRDQLKDVLPAAFRPLVQTIDSFQGREADIVIVSLVRGYPRRAQNTVYQRIGHLADPRRVNVMLSRAREFLIIVGQLNHFHDAGRLAQPDEPGAHWATICSRFREIGVVEPSTQRYGAYLAGRQ